METIQIESLTNGLIFSDYCLFIQEYLCTSFTSSLKAGQWQESRDCVPVPSPNFHLNSFFTLVCKSMDFIGVFPYMCVVLLCSYSSHHTFFFVICFLLQVVNDDNQCYRWYNIFIYQRGSLLQVVTLLLSCHKYTIFLHKYIFKSKSSDFFSYKFQTVCSNITVRTELGLLYNINKSSYFVQIHVASLSQESCFCCRSVWMASTLQE